MFKIATLNKISPVGLSHLTDNYTITENVDEANAILVRSQAMQSAFNRKSRRRSKQHSSRQMRRGGNCRIQHSGSQCQCR